MKLRFGAVAAFLVILAVLLLRMGEGCRVLPSTVEAEGTPAVSRLDDGGAESRRMDGTARVPAASSPLDVATQAAVNGIVRDTVGTPLAGVYTAARRFDGPRGGNALSTSITDTLGRFTLALPRDVLAEVAFSFPGYRPRREIVRAPASGLDVVLERSPTLQGRVVRGDGMPVSGAVVRRVSVGVGAVIDELMSEFEREPEEEDAE